MRISDWSSDVCSSDLCVERLNLQFHGAQASVLSVASATGSTGASSTGAALLLAAAFSPAGYGAPSGWGSFTASRTRSHAPLRSEERRVGKERVRTRRSRWSPYH